MVVVIQHRTASTIESFLLLFLGLLLLTQYFLNYKPHLAAWYDTHNWARTWHFATAIAVFSRGLMKLAVARGVLGDGTRPAWRPGLLATVVLMLVSALVVFDQLA